MAKFVPFHHFSTQLWRERCTPSPGLWYRPWGSKAPFWILTGPAAGTVSAPRWDSEPHSALPSPFPKCAAANILRCVSKNKRKKYLNSIAQITNTWDLNDIILFIYIISLPGTILMHIKLTHIEFDKNRSSHFRFWGFQSKYLTKFTKKHEFRLLWT